MPHFLAINKETRERLEYEAAVPQEEHFNEELWERYEQGFAQGPSETEEEPPVTAKFGGRRIFTKLEFRSLFKKATI